MKRMLRWFGLTLRIANYICGAQVRRPVKQHVVLCKLCVEVCNDRVVFTEVSG